MKGMKKLNDRMFGEVYGYGHRQKLATFTNWGSNIVVVAVLNEPLSKNSRTEWCAYIGVVDEHEPFEDELDRIARNGTKISSDIAKTIFDAEELTGGKTFYRG